MIEMVRRFLRQKLASPVSVIGLAFLALLSALAQASSPAGEEGLTVFARGLAVFLLAEGLIARDIANGALQMILARPVRRSAYLAGRFAGVLACFVLFLVVSAVAGIALSPVFGNHPDYRARLVSLAGGLLDATQLAAVLLLFGTFLPGWSNVLALILLYLGLVGPVGLSGPLHAPSLGRLFTKLHENILPSVAWSDVFSGGNFLRTSLGEYVLAVAVSLIAALAIFSRREFVYGQD